MWNWVNHLAIEKTRGFSQINSKPIKTEKNSKGFFYFDLWIQLCLLSSNKQKFLDLFHNFRVARRYIGKAASPKPTQQRLCTAYWFSAADADDGNVGHTKGKSQNVNDCGEAGKTIWFQITDACPALQILFHSKKAWGSGQEQSVSDSNITYWNS